MNQRIFVLPALLLAVGAAVSAQASTLQAQDDNANKGPGYTIVGARVFDGERWLPAGTQVRVQHGLVLAVGPDVGLPRGGTLIDGTGKTLLPGAEAVAETTESGKAAKTGCHEHDAIVAGARADLRLVNGSAREDWSGLGEIVARWKSGVLIGHRNTGSSKPL